VSDAGSTCSSDPVSSLYVVATGDAHVVQTHHGRAHPAASHAGFGFAGEAPLLGLAAAFRIAVVGADALKPRASSSRWVAVLRCRVGGHGEEAAGRAGARLDDQHDEGDAAPCADERGGTALPPARSSELMWRWVSCSRCSESICSLPCCPSEHHRPLTNQQATTTHHSAAPSPAVPSVNPRRTPSNGPAPGDPAPGRAAPVPHAGLSIKPQCMPRHLALQRLYPLSGRHTPSSYRTTPSSCRQLCTLPPTPCNPP
jgi:hypothetical protein